MAVNEGAAGKAEVAELVVVGHVVHEADVGDVECGSQERHDGGLERSKVVLVGQSQQVQDYLGGQEKESIASNNLLSRTVAQYGSSVDISAWDILL